MREREGDRLTKEKQKIHDMKTEAQEEYDRLHKLILEDDNDRQRREAVEQAKI